MNDDPYDRWRYSYEIVRSGKMDFIQWLCYFPPKTPHLNKAKQTYWPEVMYSAIEFGNLELIEWLVKVRPLTKLKYRRTGQENLNRQIWDDGSFAHALISGRMEVINYIVENGCPRGKFKIGDAIFSGKVGILFLLSYRYLIF